MFIKPVLTTAYYINGMERFLDIIAEHMEIHSTFSDDVSKIPNYIINHGECVIIMYPCQHLYPYLVTIMQDYYHNQI